jgi:tRNA threonylcarbamoyladenosine biosynthesis protein TsaE
VQTALRVVSTSPEETRILGAAIAPVLLPGDVISLTGDLGAGKTVFVQGLATALGVTSRVTSPTFTIVHEYAGRYPIVHVDIYRLESFQEVLDLGFEEFLEARAIVTVEWGEAVEPLLPRAHLRVDIRRVSDPDDIDRRVITFRPTGEDWITKVVAMRETAEALLDAASPDVSEGSRFELVSRDDEGEKKEGIG